MRLYITHTVLPPLPHTYCGGVSGGEGVGTQPHEEAGLAHVRVPNHQDLEDVVRLGSEVLNELQRLQCVYAEHGCAAVNMEHWCAHVLLPTCLNSTAVSYFSYGTRTSVLTLRVQPSGVKLWRHTSTASQKLAPFYFGS